MGNRVVFLHEIPHVKGGSSSSMLDLTRHFSSTRQVLVIGHDTPQMQSAARAAGAEYHAIPTALWSVGFSRPIRSLINLIRLQLAIRRALRPGDTLVVNGILGEFIAGWGWLISSYPRVYFVRGAVGESRLWRLMSLRGLCAVVAISGFVREQFLRQFPRFSGRIENIPNAIALPALASSPPPAPPFRFGCVGFIHPLKNQALAVRALGLLRQRGIDAKLDIFGEAGDSGDGEYLVELRGLIAAQALGEHVVFHGFAAREKIYSGIHVLVSPSLSEGFGKTIAEAMAHGLPAVALSAAGGPRDIIERPEEGVLLDSTAPDALAAALERLALDSDLRVRMGLAARESVARRFTPQTIAARALSVIDSASS